VIGQFFGFNYNEFALFKIHNLGQQRLALWVRPLDNYRDI